VFAGDGAGTFPIFSTGRHAIGVAIVGQPSDRIIASVTGFPQAVFGSARL
jgi:hypothetical protein